ncbi:uncharacterized protein Tco025E_00039 [Trypanosoma conorhini]|uniref:PH-like domain-containing protein n=1 Tax=Trypanosoma conorhini TaxID=83891 RepID=A0A3R7NVB2_9TRYP|nr:uncharacterized protein Tco025E_00039 [Trypanosoma conorhini]RNF27655.1 hypothetical protein Tco025E_00039 [Trypanosoma conorhini]
MHDIIAAPLGALPGAVDAILRRPEELDDVEVQSIFKEASFILLRAEEALASRDPDAFCVLFKLFSEGFAHDESSFGKGIETFGENAALLQTLRDIFRVAVEQRVFSTQSLAVVELVQVVGSLCDGSAIKDVCGALFMEGLAYMLDDMYRRSVEEAHASFLAQRAAATALINLVKGSKQNKQRIGSWNFLADCCALSVDVFFQLQCIELLFRLSRHNKSLLTQICSRLRPRVLENIRQLPNDSTLLAKMVELLHDINEAREDILSFPVNRVDVAHTTIMENTLSYFTMNYFVVLVTSSNADNVTIPYRSIRSVTLGKDGRVVFRLEEFPTKLGALLSRAAGEDTIVLFMTVEQLSLFKESRIRSWIVSALESRKGRKRSSTHAANGAAAATPPASHDAPTEETAKRHRADSLQLTGGDSHVLAVFQKIIKASDDDASAVLEKMKQLISSKNESRHQEVAAILDASMKEIQRMVDEGHVATDGVRANIREDVEGSIQGIEHRLLTSQAKAAEVVEKLNLALQELKASNTAIHEQIACIEITLQQSLEVSREEEANVCKLLKTEGEENTEQIETLLDRQLMGQSDPMNVISEFLRTSAAGSVF